MDRREFLTGAGALAAVGAGRLWAEEKNGSSPFFRGVNYGFYARNGYFSSPQAQRDVDDMAALGLKWVCVISTVMQDTFASTRTFRDSVMTPGDDEICDIVAALHKKGIKVMLRPMIECWDGTQRCHVHLPEGQIFPDRPFSYRTRWFESYRALTAHYTRVAAKCGCEAYGFDSELNSLVPHTDDWLGVIETARKHYRGHLTSSFIDTQNFLKEAANPNHWFHALDSVGTSMYCPVSKDGGGTMAEMVENVRRDIVPKCRAFADAYGKAFYFGECGCCSTKGATRKPWGWDNPGGYDGTEQANYLQAIVTAFSAESWWRGLLWWKWDEQNVRPQFRDDPAGDKGFTIRGKPAAEVMKRWCAAST